MEFTKNQKIIFFVAVIIIAAIFLIMVGILPGKKSKNNTSSTGITGEAKLEFWGIDEKEYFQNALNSFREINPNIEINYTQVAEASYEAELVDAIASGRGPDIFMVRHDWIRKHFEKIAPLAGLSLKDFKESFVDVVSQDLIYQDKIWALPLWTDTLALYYNKDFFNTEGLVQPPKTWQQFLDYSQRLTKKSLAGKIERSGVSLGTAKNIADGSDILLAMMIQTGIKILDERGQTDFDRSNGENVLSFYASFANPASAFYCWSNSLPDSVEAFSRGQTAMLIDYSSAREKIKKINPYLNYGIAGLPQISEEATALKKNYGNYWALTTTVGSPYAQAAWSFIFNVISQENILNYLNLTGRVPAEKELLNNFFDDENLGVFAKQALIAQSWPDPNPLKSKQIFDNMIESVAQGRFSVSQALDQAAEELRSLIK